jgi:hypothetical protein
MQLLMPPVSSTSHFLVHFDRLHRRLIVTLIGIFVLLLCFKEHGYSLPQWHSYIDNSKADEVISGSAKGIRSDDWALDLPMVIAQAATSSFFPVKNGNIGDGQSMLMPMQTPVFHPVGIFRPSTWGFIAGVDVGLSWMWWSVFLGLFYGVFLLLLLLTKNRFGWSALGAAGFVWSPIFQMWSLHWAQVPLHACFLFVGTIHLLFSQQPKIILWSGVLAGWSAGCLAFHYIYPPVQVTIGLLTATIFLGYLIENRGLLDLRSHGRYRLYAGGIAMSIVLLAIIPFLISGQEQILSIMNTTYPGQRMSLGGGMTWQYFFSNNFLLPLKIKDWSALGNICEASFGMFFAPLLLGCQIVICIREKRLPSALPLLLIVYIALAISYSIYGLPSWLAQITFMNRATANRTQMGLLMADLCFAAVVSTQLFATTTIQHRRIDRLLASALLFLWALLLAFVAQYLSATSNELSRTFAIWIFSLNIILVWLLIGLKKPIMFFAGFFLLSFSATYRFNPIVIGGAKYLRENPVSTAILATNEEYGPGSWVVIQKNDDGGNWPIGNLLRMLGVRSIGGYACGPPLKSLRVLDPQQQFSTIYNQCAFLSFLSEEGPHIDFASPSPGQILARISPNHEVFANLGVNYILFVGGVAPDPIDKSQFVMQSELATGARIYRRIIPAPERNF